MTEVLVFMANGSEEIETVSAINILRRGNVDVKSVSIEEGLMITGSRDIKMQADLNFNQLDEKILKNVKMFVLPGGLGGYKKFKAHKPLLDLLKKANESPKYICAICAAPSFLGENGFLQGIDATCYPGFEENLIGANLKNESVVLDKNFITGKGPAFSSEFALKLLETLKGDEVLAKVKASLLI